MAGVRLRIDRKPTDLQTVLTQSIDNDKTRRGVNQVIADMVEPYVPAKSGELRRSVRVGPKTISWTKPYARYQYYGQVYGPNIPIIRQGIIVGWFSRPGVKKHPTGRELGIPGFWKGWTFGYTTPDTKHHWLAEMMKSERRRMQIRITYYLKRRVKEAGK